MTTLHHAVRGRRSPAALGALALAAVLAAGSAQATEALYTLQGLADSGPLAETPFIGSFAYDASAAAGDFSGSIALSRFVLDFAGQAYTLASADAAPTAVFDLGVFLGLDYVDADSADLSVRPDLALVPGFFGFDGEAYLAYEAAGGIGGYGSYRITAVPEAGTAAMLLAGLGLLRLSGVAWRRRV